MLKNVKLIDVPFWSRIPALGLRYYPAGTLKRVIFWFSSMTYSLVYFYLIALMVVIFSHALWVWTSLQNYLTTALYDIVFKNWWLIVPFVALESYLIYLEARLAPSRESAEKKPSQGLTYLTFAVPLIMIVVMYSTLKLWTKEYVLEPNFVPVMVSLYAVFFLLKYSIDKYLPSP